MAAATPVLERRLSALEKKSIPVTENPEEIQHNAQIREKYARLMDRSISVNELMGREEEVDTSSMQKFNQSEYYKANPHEALFGNRSELNAVNNNNAPAAPRIELVTNARADADIFRADSPINQRYFAEQQIVNDAVMNEDESEDLRPTPATIQYGSAERINDEAIPTSTVKETEKAETRPAIGKREKIIIGTFISMVVALFVLVIINSAIISKLNSDINTAEESLAAIESEYARVYESVEDAKSVESVYEYALQNNMEFVGTEG